MSNTNQPTEATLARREDKRKQRERAANRRNRKSALIQAVLFFLTLFVLAVCSALLFLRPTYSETEKRELTKFPSFTIASLLNGDYFENIGLWFSDTFPFRENFLTLNNSVSSLYGFSSTEVHGAVTAGDDIPDSTDTDTTEAVSETESEAEETTALDTQDLGAVLIVGDSAYEYYNFVLNTADTYIAAVNRLSDQLDESINLYDMVVPTSMDIILPDSYRESLNTSDQQRAITYLYGSMKSRVNTVDVYSALKSARSDYIYFRTDHHWTATGAYLAYEQYAAAAGFTATSLNKFKEVSYDGFLGSFYSDTESTALSRNPDTVTTYKPADTNDITITKRSGEVVSGHIVEDVSTWSAASKYSAFIGGDNPLSVITNENADGVCVVVKESFGNAFVPFLVGNYGTIYVVDYRYFNEISDMTLAEYAQSVGANDVLLIQNISATRSKSLMQYFSDLIGE